MKLSILAIGRAQAGAEQTLTTNYLEQTNNLVKRSRLGPATLRCLEAKTPGRAAESQLLLKNCKAEVMVALDERGKQYTSEVFAQKLQEWRDHGVREVGFLIGGADGHTAEIRSKAQLVLSLSAMVWPHALVRVMLAEQLFRAATISINHPYHRA